MHFRVVQLRGDFMQLEGWFYVQALMEFYSKVDNIGRKLFNIACSELNNEARVSHKNCRNTYNVQCFTEKEKSVLARRKHNLRN